MKYHDGGRNIGLQALLMQFQDYYKYNNEKEHARERICSPNSVRLVYISYTICDSIHSFYYDLILR